MDEVLKDCSRCGITHVTEKSSNKQCLACSFELRMIEAGNTVSDAEKARTAMENMIMREVKQYEDRNS